MKKVEITIVLLALIAIVLKLLSIVGGILLLTLSMGVLWLLYLFLGFLLLNNIPLKSVFKKNVYDGVNLKKIFWSITAGISLSTGVMGILFKVNKWEGGTLMLQLGTLFLLPIAVVSLSRYIPKPTAFHAGILIRSGIFILVSIILLAT